MKSPIQEKCFALALRVVKLYKYLTVVKREFILAKQVLRSGTATGAMIREAQNAESKADFIHKLSIAQKECAETIYWLQLLYHSKILNSSEFASIHQQQMNF